MPYRLIDPDETLDYSCDWRAYLHDDGRAVHVVLTKRDLYP